MTDCENSCDFLGCTIRGVECTQLELLTTKYKEAVDVLRSVTQVKNAKKRTDKLQEGLSPSCKESKEC
jgi:hypothetical protein